MIDHRLFREAMGKFATGITVVTTLNDQEIVGMTVNAFMSISLDPKLIAISIDESATMYNILPQTKQFGVSILRKEQKDLAMIFAKQKEKDRDIDYIYRHHTPVLKNSLATLSCQVKQQIKAGDHKIFIGEVKDLQIKDGKPLLYYDSNYQTVQSQSIN